MKRAKTIQICGTGSGVGKSVIVAGLCRIFLQEGYKVAPFKAQNMALNSAVTPDGLEIGRAQAMQADACGIRPSVDMNPVLLKPTSDVGSQVIVHGKPIGNMTANRYYKYKPKIFGKVKQSLNRLLEKNDIVIIEGAGSPAEINLKKHDIVNMKIAKLINSPVILVGDIDKGGVFAWLLGTVDLLSADERKLVKGFIINKFRGDKSLLDSGLQFLETKSHKKVLGVVPYYKDIKLPEEDSLYFETMSHSQQSTDHRPQTKDYGLRTTGHKINIAVIKLPHISNFTDFDALERESDVDLKYIYSVEELTDPDIIILPGTKNTIKDLIWLKKSGITSKILSTMNHKPSTILIGICGGYQMLGRGIRDDSGVEGGNNINGLGLLDMDTVFEKEKNTFIVEAKDLSDGSLIKGYEIHHGQSSVNCPSLFLITKRGSKNVRVKDGVMNSKGNVWGTYIHGIFDNFSFRQKVLNQFRKQKKLSTRNMIEFSQDKEYDKLAGLLRQNVDMKLLKKIMGLC